MRYHFDFTSPEGSGPEKTLALLRYDRLHRGFGGQAQCDD